MKKEKIEKVEDIYPLTIISMRYGGKIVIFNRESDSEDIHEIQLGEEAHYDLNKWLDEHISPNCYGVGATIWEAFEDFKKRYYDYK